MCLLTGVLPPGWWLRHKAILDVDPTTTHACPNHFFLCFVSVCVVLCIYVCTLHGHVGRSEVIYIMAHIGIYCFEKHTLRNNYDDEAA